MLASWLVLVFLAAAEATLGPSVRCPKVQCRHSAAHPLEPRCQMCVQIVEKGHRCSPQLQCDVGLECNTTSSPPTCVPQSEEDPIVKGPRCLASRHSRAMANKEGPMLLWLPDCDSQGLFEPRQCHSHKCLCHDPYTGRRLFGLSEKGKSPNMTCECAVRIASLASREDWKVRPEIHCTSTGDFDALQCEGEICYCADPTTGRPTGRLARRPQLHLLPCFDPERHETGYLRECEREDVRVRSLEHRFRLKGVNVIGLQKFHCDPDGSFASKQCLKQKCLCFDPHGTPIAPYALDITRTSETMLCDCAREEWANNKLSHFPQLSCQEAGNFLPLQCHNSVCFCVDNFGHFITNPSEGKTLTHDTCREFASKWSSL